MLLVASRANVLILDEPTNHLDIEAGEALEDALRSRGHRPARFARPRARPRGRACGPVRLGQPDQQRTGYDAAHAAAKKAVEEAYARWEQAST